MNTPAIFNFEKIDLKKRYPVITVNTGVREFNTPAAELETVVCACVKRKAGIPFPKMPLTAINFQRLDSIFLKCPAIKGSRQIKATDKRIAATWDGVNCSNPRFI